MGKAIPIMKEWQVSTMVFILRSNEQRLEIYNWKFPESISLVTTTSLQPSCPRQSLSQGRLWLSCSEPELPSPPPHIMIAVIFLLSGDLKKYESSYKNKRIYIKKSTYVTEHIMPEPLVIKLFAMADMQVDFRVPKNITGSQASRSGDHSSRVVPHHLPARVRANCQLKTE